MSENILAIFLGITGGLFALIVVAYLIVSKNLKKSDTKKIQQLREGTKDKTFSWLGEITKHAKQISGN